MNERSHTIRLPIAERWDLTPGSWVERSSVGPYVSFDDCKRIAADVCLALKHVDTGALRISHPKDFERLKHYLSDEKDLAP